LLSHKSRDCACVLRLVEPGDNYDNSVVVARCIIDKIEQQESSIRVLLLGQDSRLDKPLQPVMFPGTLPNPQLRGTPLPITLGSCIQVACPQINPVTLEYQIADVGETNVAAVYSGGSPYDPPQWTSNAQGTGFVSTITPAARVTADVVGPMGRYDDLLDSEGVFTADGAWDGPDLDRWNVTGAGSVARIIYAGAHLQWPASGQVTIWYDDTNVLPDTNAGWYMVSGRVADKQGGANAHLGIRFRDTGTLVRIHDEGEFCRLVYVEAGGDRSIRIGGSDLDLGAGGIVVESLRVYQVDDISVENYLVNLVWNIALRGGLTDDNFDNALIVRGDQGWIRDIPVSYHQQDNTTARQAIAQVMQSVAGWAYVGPDGYMRLGTVDEPAGDPDIILSSLNLTSHPVFEPDTAPGLSDTLGAQKVWSPYTEDELAGITHIDRPPFMADYRYTATGSGVLARMYQHAVGADPIGTLITTQVDADFEADRITHMHESEWGFWMQSVAFNTPQEAAALLPGDKAGFDPDLFGEEFESGQIVGVDGEFGDNNLTLIVRARRAQQ
jgi:hypothetical protein